MKYLASLIGLLIMSSYALAFKDNVAFVTAKSGLNIRSQPTVKSKKVDRIRFGDKVHILGLSDNKDTFEGITDYWYKISFKDRGLSDWNTKKLKIGWVFGGYLTDRMIPGFHSLTIAKYKGKSKGDYLRLIVEMPDKQEKRFWKFRKFIGLIEYIKATQPDDSKLKGKMIKVVWAKRTVLTDDVPTGEKIKEIDMIEILEPVLQSIPSYYRTDPGQGIIVATSHSSSEVIDFPKQIGAYASPHGKQIGYVVNDENEESYLRIFIHENSNNRYQIKGKDIYVIGHEKARLKYYQTSDNFIKIMKYSHESGVWIKMDELLEKNYAHKDYFKYFISAKGSYHPEQHTTIDLMDKPRHESRHLFTVNGSEGHYLIHLTGRAKNQWAEVKVDEFDKNSQVSNSTAHTYRGWIRILDEKGFPKIENRAKGISDND